MKSRSLLLLITSLLLGGLIWFNSTKQSGHTTDALSHTKVAEGDLTAHQEPLQVAPVEKMRPAVVTQRELSPIFKAVGGKSGLHLAVSDFEGLFGYQQGDEVSLALGNATLSGTLTSVQETADSRSVIVELSDQAGRLHLASNQRGLTGEAFFYGDSRMLQIREFPSIHPAVRATKMRISNTLDQSKASTIVKVESGQIHEFYCAPVGSYYTQSGLVAGSAGLKEPLSSTFPPFDGVPDPVVALTAHAGRLVDAPTIDASTNLIYLDFDGGVFGQDQSPLLPAAVAAEPHQRVNDEAWVRAVHMRVAEDFAPFNVHITTDHVLFDDAALDPLKTVHVVITPTDDAGPGLGGISKLDAFGVDETPIVWVFNYSEYAVASTISHEVGHALGLDEDGTASETYYGGHNGGYAPGWAPIMGAPWNDAETVLYDEVDQWSQGEYAGASNDQNDVLIIASKLGYIVDDYVERFEDRGGLDTGSVGDPDSGPEVNEAGNRIMVGEGLISTTEDVDLFEIVVDYTGLLNVTVAPLDVDVELEALLGPEAVTGRQENGARTQGANLAVDLELLDDSGIRVALGSNHGDAALGSQINEEDLEAGTYYLIIEGAARGGESSGISDYGSLGIYNIEVEMVSGSILVSGHGKGLQPIANASTDFDVQNATDFEFVVRNQSAEHTFQIYNPEAQTVVIEDVFFADGSDFSVSSYPSSVKAGTGKDFKLTFNPSGSGYVATDVVTIAYRTASMDPGDDPLTFTFTVGGTAIASAETDNYENNRATSSATNLSGEEDTWLSDYKGLATQPAPDERDWYRFTVDPDDDQVTLSVNYDDVYDISFTLKVKNNTKIVDLYSTSDGSGELSYVIPEDKKGVHTEFYVLVEANTAADPDALNVYDLKWTAVSLTGGLDEDTYNNSTRETAFDLTAQRGDPLSNIRGKGILNGEAWYKFTVPLDRSAFYNRALLVEAIFNEDENLDPVNIDIEVFVEFDQDYSLAGQDELFPLSFEELGFGDFRGTLHNQFPTTSTQTEGGRELVSVGDWVFTNEFIGAGEFSNPFPMGVHPGTYYVRVYSPDEYTGASYDFSIKALVEEDNYEQLPDEDEENDRFATAYDLGTDVFDQWLSEINGPGFIGELGSDPEEPDEPFDAFGDDDWFKVTISEGATQLNIDYQMVSFVFLTVYDSNNQVVAQNTEPLGDNVTVIFSRGTLTIRNPSDTEYYLLFGSGFGVSTLDGYDFRITTTELPPVEDRNEDIFEENDNYLSPYNLTDYEGLSLAAAGGYGAQYDPDWYLIDVPAGATEVTVDCLYDTSMVGEIDLRMRRASGVNLPLIAEDIDNGKRIVWNSEDSVPVEGGQYAILVTGDDIGANYNLTWNVVRADDSYEENDDFASAEDLTDNEHEWLRKINGTGIQADKDYYEIVVPDAGMITQLQVRTFFDPTEGDIDIALHRWDDDNFDHILQDSEVSWITASENTDTVEEITVFDPLAGTYIVEVYYGDAGNEYDLWWAALTQIEVDTLLADDSYENNDTLASAYALGESEAFLRNIDGQGRQSDDDWYSITVSDGNVGLDVECEFQPQYGDIDIELYDALGGLLARSASDDGPSGPFDSALEIINFGAPVPEGTYYIRVYGANRGTDYDLYWVERLPDAYEPNDSLEAAFDLVAEGQIIPQVQGTQSDDDWFEIEVFSDTAYLGVDLEYTHYFGNIDFAIYDADGNEIWTVPAGNKPAVPPVDTDEPAERLRDFYAPFTESTFLPVSKGTYYIKVFGGDPTTYAEENPAFDTPGGNRWNSYTLDWAEVQDDAYEFDREDVVLIENDDRASVLGDPSHPSNLSGQDGVVHDALQFDDDWYQVTLDAGNQALAVRIEYDHANSDIDLAIYNNAGDLLEPDPAPIERDPDDITEEDPATKEDNRESYFYFAPDNSGGDYFIRVYGDGNRNSSYELIWTQAIGDDELEENDALGVATSTELPEDLTYVNPVTRLSVILDAFPSNPDLINAIQYDEDWYRIEKEDGEVQLGVKLDFNTAKGDLAFAIYDALGNELMVADGDIDDEFQIFWASPDLDGTEGVDDPDIYYVKVFGDNLGNEYNIQWATSFVDIYESSTGNNFIDHATDLRGQEALRMSEGLGYATSGDEDWYQIEIAAGDDHVIVEAFREFASDDGFAMELFKPSSDDTYQSVSFAKPEPNVDSEPTIQRIVYQGSPGTYYLRVFGGLMGNPYDLFWQSYKEDVLELAADEFATKFEGKNENDTPGLPRALQFTTLNNPFYPEVPAFPSVNLELVLLEDLAQADADWYWIDADGEGRLIIDLQFEHQKGDIDMAVYEGRNGRIAPGAGPINVLDGNGSLQGISNTDNERIDLNLAELGLQTFGPYLLVVYGHGVEAPEKLTDIGDVNDASTYVRAFDPSDGENFDETAGLGNTYSLRWSSEVEDFYDVETPEIPDDVEINDAIEVSADLGILWDLSMPTTPVLPVAGAGDLSPDFLSSYSLFLVEYDTFVYFIELVRVLPDQASLPDNYFESGFLEHPVAPVYADYASDAAFLVDYNTFQADYADLLLEYSAFLLQYAEYLEDFEEVNAPEAPAAPELAQEPWLPFAPSAPAPPVEPEDEDAFYDSFEEFQSDYLSFSSSYAAFENDYAAFKQSYDAFRDAYNATTRDQLIDDYDAFILEYDAFFAAWSGYADFLNQFTDFSFTIPVVPTSAEFDADLPLIAPELPEFSDLPAQPVLPDLPSLDSEDLLDFTEYETFLTAYEDTFLVEYDAYETAYDDLIGFFFDDGTYAAFDFDLRSAYFGLFDYRSFLFSTEAGVNTTEFTIRSLAQFDDDWYRLTILSPNAHSLYSRIDFDHVRGDLSYELYDSSGNFLSDSVSDNDYELVTKTAQGNQTYYLRVMGENVGTEYTLYARSFVDDEYEIADDGTENDDFAGAVDVRYLQQVLPVIDAYNPATYLEYGTLHGISLDNDYYIIAVPKDQVHLWVDVGDGLGSSTENITFQIFDLDETLMPWTNDQNGSWYNLIPPDATLYFIRVFSDFSGVPYTLRWKIDNVDSYEVGNNGGVWPNLRTGTGTQEGDNNTWLDAYHFTPSPVWAPEYNNKIKYKDPMREVVYDDAVIQGRFNSGSQFLQDFPVGHGTQLDDDWYSLRLPSWELVTAKKKNKEIKVLKRIYNVGLEVDLTFESDDGNINVEVYYPDDLAADGFGVAKPLSAVSLEPEEDTDRVYISVPVDPLHDLQEYYIRVYGDNNGNSYEFTWKETRDDLYESNGFVDQAHDLTLAYDAVTDDDGDEPRQADEWSLVGGEPTDFISSEGKWLHEMWQFTDVDGDGVIDPEMHADDSALGNGDGIVNFGEAYSPSETKLRGYGNQSTDDWYAIAVSDGSTELSVQANFYADDNTDHTYAPDDLDFAIDLYRLVEDERILDTNGNPIRKPILIRRINENDKETEPFPARKHPIAGDLDYPLTEPGGAIDLDTGERIEGGTWVLPILLSEPDLTGGIYFIRIFYDNRRHPYTFKWDDGVVDNAGDLAIIDDYINGGWSYTPDLVLPEDILNPGGGDENDNGYPDWFEVALVLNPADFAIPGEETEAESDLRDAVVGMVRTVEANGVEDEYYTVTYLRSTEAVALGFEFTVQQTVDLIDPWEAALAEQEVSVEIVAPGIERVVYRAPVPTDEEPMYYFRVSVTEPAIP